MSERKLLVCIEFLTEERKRRIEEACKTYGFTPVFYEKKNVVQAIPAAKTCEVLLGSSPELVAAAGPDLKWFCCTFAGVEPYVEHPELFANPNCLLTNSNCYGVSIADYVVMTALMLLKRMPDYAEIIRKREWINTLRAKTIHGMTITVLGTGNIGQTVASRMRGMGAGRILGVNRSGKAPRTFFDEVHPVTEIDRVLPETDLLVMAVPATRETQSILSRERIALLPAESYVINVGRGSTLDQEALREALNSGKLAGAALDVMEPEPLPKDHPLWDTKNLILTPHLSGKATLEYTCEAILDLFLADLARYAKGEPLAGLVDRKIGY